MALRVYNTLSRSKEDFTTVEPGKVSMYLCGPTVYKPAHIGHLVGPVIFDTVKRYLTWHGYEVTFVINITDVDDKLINRARENNTTVEELAGQMTEDYFENLQTIGVDSVDHFPRATDYIDAMLEMIGRLVDNGHAYPLDGDVYFEVTKDDDYGKLSRRNIEDTQAGTRVEANERKHNPADFALWKRSKDGEPGWDSPWGRGRPGWHIECSAMSSRLLGDSIDIHGGGLDLLFPHHENELAQSECCSGKPFVRYWLHNGLMQSGDAGKVGGQHSAEGDVVIDQAAQEANKLSGSLGAESVKTAVFSQFTPETVRFFLLSTHYRSPIPLNEDSLAETAKSLDGFYRLFESFERATGTSAYDLPVPARQAETTALDDGPEEFFAELRELRDRFVQSMDDDFNTGGATGVLFELRRCLNAFITSSGLDKPGAHDATATAALTTGMTLLRELTGILGLFRQPVAQDAEIDDAFAGRLMDLLIEVRGVARKAKQFEIADCIRDGLAALDVTLEDRADGTGWRRG